MTSSSQVFARTAKGDLEATGSTRLSAGLLKILRLVDGSSSVSELSSLAGVSRALLENTLEILVEDGMVKLSGRKDPVPPPPAPLDRNHQSASKPQSRNQPEPQDPNLSPATDFLGQMMREVQHGLAGGKPDAAALASPAPEAPSKVSELPFVPPLRSDAISSSRYTRPISTEAQAKEQEVVRRKAEMAAKPGAERYAKLKADAQAKTVARETEFLAAAANAKELAVAKANAEDEAKLRAQAEAKANEAERKQLALQQEAHARAAQAKAREDKMRRRTDEAARLKTEAEKRAVEEHQARLKAEAETYARDEELKRLAQEADARAQAAAGEARLKAEAEARTREEEMRGRADEAARLKVEAEARAVAQRQAHLKAEAAARAKDEELKRMAAEARARDEKAGLEAEYQARLKAQAEYQARVDAEAEQQAQAKTEAEELERLAVETEARARDEKAALEAEHQARLEAQAEYQARLDAEASAREEETRRVAAEEARFKAEAEARAKEEERQRLADEADARACEAETRRLAAEQARLKAEAEARAREEERKQLEAEARQRAEEEARLVAQAEMEVQARMKADEAARAKAEYIAAEEARIKQAILARSQVSMTNDTQDQYGLPDLPVESEKFAGLGEPRLNIPIEPTAPVEHDPIANRNFEDTPAPIPQRKDEPVQPSGFSPAQRAHKSPSWAPKLDDGHSLHVRRRRVEIPWGKVLAAVLVLGVIALGALPLFPQTQLRLEAERMLTESLGAPVSIAAATLELFPTPLVRFENISIGEPAIVRIGAIKAAPDTGAWLRATNSFRAAELGAVGFTPQSYGRVFELLLAMRNQLKLPVRRIVIPDMSVPANGLGLSAVAAALELLPEGGLRKVIFTEKNGQMTVELEPQDSHFELTLSAATWRVPGTDITLESLNAAGQLKKNEFVIANFNGRAYGGRIEARGTLRWADRWRLNGTFKANGLNIERFADVAVVSQGNLDLNGRFEATADDSVNLQSRLKVGGKFSLQAGKLSGIDIARAIAESPKDVFGGMTPFKTLDGVFQSSAGSHELRDMRLAGGSLSASGQARLSPAKELSGRLSATLIISPRRMQETLYLSGSATNPIIRSAK